MAHSYVRRAALAAGAAAALVLSAFAAAPASAALYACVKPNAAVHVFTHRPKCHQGEQKISWGTSGPAGKNGANGQNGASGTNGASGHNGADGGPQAAIRVKATVERGGPVATLFTADGIRYTFDCEPFFGANFAVVSALGSTGQSYGSGVFTRPVGQESKETDPKAFAIVASIGGSEPTKIAQTGTVLENVAKQFEDYGVWTVTVEGPNTLTTLHLWLDAAEPCSVHGLSLTFPG
jgi:hypothetical protein